MRRALAITVLALLTACKSDPGGEGAACEKKEDCAEGLSCVDGVCTKLEQASEPEASAYCTTLEALAGNWTFDTTVVGAEDLVSKGINGHFQMTVKVDGCNATIALTKTGHDDTVYTKAKIQHSEGPLHESATIPGAAEIMVSLKDKPTHELIFMVRDKQLFGHFRYVESEWNRAGMWGYLRGVPEGTALAEVENFEVQPCEVKCLTQCDADRRKADQTLDQAALSACMTSCSAGPPSTDAPVVAGCTPGKPMHEHLSLHVNGPAKSIEELCAKVFETKKADAGITEAGPICQREPEVDGKPTERALAKARFEGSFHNAQLLEVGLHTDSYATDLVLAMETEAGWFWTDSIVNLEASAGGLAISIKSMSLRPRELVSAVGREVIAEVDVYTTDSDLGINEVSIDETRLAVVCSTGSPPVCVRVITNWSSERTLISREGDDPKKHPDLRAAKGEVYLAILPGDLVSVSAPADARAEDRELAGIYAWPK